MLNNFDTLDVGNPQLSMHSIREIGGVDDVKNGTDLLKVIFLMKNFLFVHLINYLMFLGIL